MKITHNKVGQNLNLTDAGKADKANKAGGTAAPAEAKSVDPKSILAKDSGASSSKVEVSSRAQDMKRIKDIATATPDVDEAKVAKFQKMIDEGKYQVNAEAVADKMVDDHMLLS